MIVLIILFVIVFAGLSGIKSKDDSMYRDNKYGSGIEYDDERFVKYIYGRRCETKDDLTEWYVLYGFASAIEMTLNEIEENLRKGICSDCENARKNWQAYYNRYRALCLRHRFWNKAIGDDKPFIEDVDQIQKEKALFNRIDALTKNTITELNKQKELISDVICFLSEQSRESALWSDISEYLSKKHQIEKKACSAILRKMTSMGIITTSTNKEGHLVVKRIPRGNLTDNKNIWPDDFAGQFDENLYSNIELRMKLKVRHTVGEPTNLDAINGQCDFASLSQERVYHTSFTKCTCPAYIPGQPCKHMVALAVKMNKVRI